MKQVFLLTECDDRTVRVFEIPSGKLLCMPHADDRAHNDQKYDTYHCGMQSMEFVPTGELSTSCWIVKYK